MSDRPPQLPLFLVPTAEAEGRRCRDCGELKPFRAFKIHSQSPNFPYPSCKQCDRRHDEIVARADYWQVAESQGGVFCGICGNPQGRRRLQIDVDRSTWTVRGLLCFNCNSGLGKFHHDVALLNRARNYLKVTA